VGLLCFFFLCAPSAADETLRTLAIYTWEDYIPEVVLESFSKEHNIIITHDTFGSESEMLGTLQSYPHKYDIVIASENTLRELVALKYTAPIDLTRLPSITLIDPSFLKTSALALSDGIPYLWGSTGIAYNTKYVEKPEKSWGLLWDSRYAGKIGMLNDIHEVIESALKYQGYSINTHDMEEIEKARKKVLEQTRLVQGYYNPVQMQELLKSEELWIAQLYSGDGLTLFRDNPHITYYIPEEGANIWVDYFFIPKNALHKNEAHLFLEHMLQPEEAALCVNDLWYGSCNTAAKEFYDEELKDSPFLTRKADMYKECEYRNTSEYNRSSDSIDKRKLYNRTWAEIQSLKRMKGE
jgi:spermidine/putrescine-binding protein